MPASGEGAVKKDVNMEGNFGRKDGNYFGMYIYLYLDGSTN